jgi:membrane protease YdiL (CAAX protease family)
MKNFPLTAAIFEGSLVPAAIVAGWLLGTPPLQTFQVKTTAALLGVAATVPLLAMFWLCLKCPLRPFREIAEIIEKTLMPLFRQCRLGEVAVIAALAGLGEEMLFRGVLQAAVTQEIGGPSGVWLGLVIASTLFGLLHSVTPLYALLAGLISLYLGGIWLASGNLLLPIIAHGLYDFLVLWYLRRK